MSKQRSGLFNQRRAYQYQCCVPPPPVKTIISMNYTIDTLGRPESNGVFNFSVNNLTLTLNTADATGIILNINDNNGNPIIPSLDFLNNNTLKITFIQGAIISSTIISPNSFELNIAYSTLTSIDLTFMPNQIFTNGPITIQIETL